MKTVYKEIKKNLFKKFYRLESGEVAVLCCVAMVVGIVINCLSKGGF